MRLKDMACAFEPTTPLCFSRTCIGVTRRRCHIMFTVQSSFGKLLYCCSNENASSCFSTCRARTPIVTRRVAPSSTMGSDALVPEGTGAVIASSGEYLKMTKRWRKRG